MDIDTSLLNNGMVVHKNEIKKVVSLQIQKKKFTKYIIEQRNYITKIWQHFFVNHLSHKRIVPGGIPKLSNMAELVSVTLSTMTLD